MIEYGWPGTPLGSVICGVIAVGSFIVNNAMINWLKNLYYTSDILICIGWGYYGCLLFLQAVAGSPKYPEKVFSNEAIIYR